MGRCGGGGGGGGVGLVAIGALVCGYGTDLVAVDVLAHLHPVVVVGPINSNGKGRSITSKWRSVRAVRA